MPSRQKSTNVPRFVLRHSPADRRAAPRFRSRTVLKKKGRLSVGGEMSLSYESQIRRGSSASARRVKSFGGRSRGEYSTVKPLRADTLPTSRASSSVNSDRPKRNVAGARVVPGSAGPLTSIKWRSGRTMPIFCIVARAREKSRRS